MSKTAKPGKSDRPDRSDKPDRRSAVHPGQRLREQYLDPLALSVNALALALRVPATRMSEIVNQRRAITVDTAFRLSLYFGTTPEYWLHLQSDYDLALGRNQLMARLKKEVHPRA